MSVSVLLPATTLWSAPPPSHSAFTSSSSAGWRLSRTCHRGWHWLLTLHCGSLLWRCRQDFSDGARFLSPSPPAWHGRSEFEAPNYCVSPLGCVLICHIMSHLQHCISNIPSITGRLRGEFKIALLQAIWVCGTQMCLLSCSISDTLKLMHCCCLTYKCSFPPILSLTHTNPSAAARLTPSLAMPTSSNLCVVAQAGAGRWMAVPRGCRCYSEWKRRSQRAGDSDEGESGRLPPSANNTASTARSRHLVTVRCDEIQPCFPKCSAFLRTIELQNNSSQIKLKSDKLTAVFISTTMCCT